jgi:FtsZ-binding cell division protein ZapB
MAYGDRARIEELRQEIAEIKARNAVSKYSRSTQQAREEFNKRNSRLREIQFELQGMIKKGSVE